MQTENSTENDDSIIVFLQVFFITITTSSNIPWIQLKRRNNGE